MKEAEQINFEDVEFAPLGEDPTLQQPPVQEEQEEEDIIEEEEQEEPLIEEEAPEEQEEDIEGEEADEDVPDTDQTEVPLYKSLVDKLGLDLQEEEMNALLEIEETDEGFTQAGVKIAEKLADKRFNDLMESYPEAKKLVDFQKNGGKSEEFFDAYYPPIDYNEVEIPDNDADLQKDVIAESLKNQGFEEEEIVETISDYEAGGILDKQAKRSLKLLQKNQEQQKEQFDAKQQKLAEQRKQSIEEEKVKIDSIISEEGIKGIEVPEGQRAKFKDYLYKPVTEDGKSQAIVDSENLDLETRLFIGYLQMNDFNFSDFIKTESKSKSVRNLRRSLKESDKLKDKQEGKSASYSKTPNFNKLDTIF